MNTEFFRVVHRPLVSYRQSALGPCLSIPHVLPLHDAFLFHIFPSHSSALTSISLQVFYSLYKRMTLCTNLLCLEVFLLPPPVHHLVYSLQTQFQCHLLWRFPRRQSFLFHVFGGLWPCFYYRIHHATLYCNFEYG